MESKSHYGYLDGAGMSRIQQDRNLTAKPTEQLHGHRDMLRVATARSRQISVGIVGAGFAGLRCADLLLQHGCKVTIFEARDRLGGRVAQSNHLGHMVDLGPNWIHGTDNNPILQIAKHTGTELHAWDEEQVVINTDGEPVHDLEAGEYAQLLWDDGVIADAFRYSNEHHNALDAKRSLYDFFVEKAEGMFADEPADVARRKRETFLQTASMWGSYVGSPVTRQSLKFFWLEECIEGENPFVAGTYHKILEAVATPAREGADVRLNTRVGRVFSKDAGGEMESDGHCPKPGIQTSDGSSLEFDEVVVTTPLGWLKRNLDAFQPALPARLREAIGNIGYGTLDKVYITFPSAFWDTPTSPVHRSTNGVDAQGKTPNVTATTAPLHQAPSQEPRVHYPGFTHWLAPEYAKDSNPQQWDQQGMNLAALPSACAHPTILFYIYGACSKHIADLVSSSTSEDERDAQLLSFFEPYYSRLRDYDPSRPECKPKAVLATAWANDEFAGYGSYCNFQVGLENGDKDIEAMRHGMPERGIWFAGEHTAPFVALGTSTGAYWSGEGVAKRILKAYGLEENS
ncbi:hypothetical protein LTR36_001645 [Oleoguttula mirabilis]|uniref:Amine oxidase domain-containing protein n=1 Tax=Oleoguttula mirabilis TaxID=1507867 RepID=A0AAV9JQU5_9PEZI|nr:hypothetical protein LTR36_001645 [Oleoguttula mirabilis]